jgi:hypothetical protein
VANLSEILRFTTDAVDSTRAVEIEKLADLVESQIGNILGGGYSQYCSFHCKQIEPTAPSSHTAAHH